MFNFTSIAVLTSFLPHKKFTRTDFCGGIYTPYTPRRYAPECKSYIAPVRQQYPGACNHIEHCKRKDENVFFDVFCGRLAFCNLDLLNVGVLVSVL